jgi:hypothetical protein
LLLISIILGPVSDDEVVAWTEQFEIKLPHDRSHRQTPCQMPAYPVSSPKPLGNGAGNGRRLSRGSLLPF